MSDPKQALVRSTPRQVVPTGIVHDVSSDLQQAQRALDRLEANGHPGDYRIVVQPTVVCSGQTLLEAMEDATAFVRQSPNAVVHSLDLAVVLGPLDGEREFRLSLSVSYADRFGETTGTTHHEPRGPLT
ncbi:hypothetical protein GXW83_09890 [Streptacidiphilus sp. PB12-B1b]|uniref:hypothetical protein n=1 Tax=Streptacidiphilus sp. PB12-B1b TaxID=2705012 RepID=UPI0015FB50CD|nr:hypothetical protein [Streptacidiphilus sp. PB12-B1b]QMU76001.1 hypothetical protein GXW83_09890 [Streptacidiphilus sp. PB12-B1b]